MDRRGFLKSFAALLAPALAVAVPMLGASSFSLAELERVRRILNGWSNQALDNYYAVIHPSCWKSLSEYVARDAWADRWKKYRIARRSGASEMTPRQIMADWTPPAPFNKAELGVFESVRFIESARVA